MQERKESTMYSAAFCQRLQSLMKENETRQEDIAQVVGVKRQTVGSWCNGKTVPDAVALGKMAQLFNVSADYLLGLSDCPAVDPNLQMVSEYTRLSPKACHFLHSLPAEEEPGLHDAYDVLSFLLSGNNPLLWGFAWNVLSYKRYAESCLLSDVNPNNLSNLYGSKNNLKALRYDAIEQAAECVDRYIDYCMADKIAAFNQEHPGLSVTLKKGTFEVEENPGQ